MGKVCRAHDDRLRRDVAIKVSNAQFTERFATEARSIAALSHTNKVSGPARLRENVAYLKRDTI